MRGQDQLYWRVPQEGNGGRDGIQVSCGFVLRSVASGRRDPKI